MRAQRTHALLIKHTETLGRAQTCERLKNKKIRLVKRPFLLPGKSVIIIEMLQCALRINGERRWHVIPETQP